MNPRWFLCYFLPHKWVDLLVQGMCAGYGPPADDGPWILKEYKRCSRCGEQIMIGKHLTRYMDEARGIDAQANTF